MHLLTREKIQNINNNIKHTAAIRVLTILVHVVVEMLYCPRQKKSLVTFPTFLLPFNYATEFLKTKNSLNQSMCLPNLARNENKI